MIELVGKENVKIAPARLKEVLELLKREDLIEEEEKLIEKQVKEQAKQGQEKEKSAEWSQDGALGESDSEAS